MCGKEFKKKQPMRKHSQKKHKHFSWIPVKDIKIPELIFFKIKKIIKASWDSVIAHKDLRHIIIWMQTAPFSLLSLTWIKISLCFFCMWFVCSLLFLDIFPAQFTWKCLKIFLYPSFFLDTLYLFGKCTVFYRITKLFIEQPRLHRVC